MLTVSLHIYYLSRYSIHKTAAAHGIIDSEIASVYIVGIRSIYKGVLMSEQN